MSDVVLVVTVIAFFSVAALFVPACGRITAGSVEDPELEEEEPEDVDPEEAMLEDDSGGLR